MSKTRKILPVTAFLVSLITAYSGGVVIGLGSEAIRLISQTVLTVIFWVAMGLLACAVVTLVIHIFLALLRWYEDHLPGYDGKRLLMDDLVKLALLEKNKSRLQAILRCCTALRAPDAVIRV